MDKSIIYHMGCSSKAHTTFSLAPYVICMQCVIDCFRKVESPSCQSSSPTLWDFFVVILVDQKGKEATHSEQVGSESMNQLTQKWSLFHNQGSKSKHHIAELNQVNQPSRKSGWSGL